MTSSFSPLRVSIRNASVCTFKTSSCVPEPCAHLSHMWACCHYKRRRFECTHGGVVDGHRVFQRVTPRTTHPHTTHHTPHNTHTHSTQHHTPQQHNIPHNITHHTTQHHTPQHINTTPHHTRTTISSRTHFFF